MNKKIIHICHSFEKGGISSFVEELIKLNSSTLTSHHALVWQQEPHQDYKHDNIDISKSSNKKQDFKHIIKEYDKIFVHSLMPFMLLALYRRKRDVYLFQHGISFGSGMRKYFKQLYYTFIINFLGFKVICSSNFAKQKLLKSVTILNKNLIVIIPFGIDINQKNLNKLVNDEVLRIGFAGRLVEQKRVFKIIEALKLIDFNIKVEFHIAGDGPKLKEIQLKSKEFINTKISFVFYGFIKKMDEFYSQIDVFILPSKGESFGLVVLEALCRKIPTIVFSDSGACVEFISDGFNGYIVDNEIALSKKIEDLSVPSIRNQLKLNLNKLNFRNYDIAITKTNLDAL